MKLLPTIVDVEGASQIAVAGEVNANVNESNETDSCSSKEPSVTKIVTNLKTSNNDNVSNDIQTRNLDTGYSLDTDNDTNNESPMITIITTSSNNPETLSEPQQSLISSSSPSSVCIKSGGITSEEIKSHIKQRSAPLYPDNENNYSKRVTVKQAENMSTTPRREIE